MDENWAKSIVAMKTIISNNFFRQISRKKLCENFAKASLQGSVDAPAAPKKFKIFNQLGKLRLVGTQRKKLEHTMLENLFERRTSSTKRLHIARAKSPGEDHATPF